MPRLPRYAPSLDLLGTSTIRDLQPAYASLLWEIDRRQWALATGWGGPPQWVVTDWFAGGTTETHYAPCRVPPGVGAVDLWFLVRGRGKLTITSSADATGSILRTSGGEELGQGRILRTSGQLSTVVGASTSRAVDVVASPAMAWAYADDDVLEVEMDGTADFAVDGYMIIPIHVPAP